MTDAAAEIYRCTPRQAKSAIIDCIKAGLVPFVQSSPGIGKSSIMREIASEFNLEMIDHRLSTSAPEDLSGLPNFLNGRATFSPFDIFPVVGTPVPTDKDGWMIFLDEANSATKLVQAASYKLVLDRMVGQHKLHPNVALTMAGNLASDRALVNILSTAMQSRVVHIEMIADLNEWLEDVAIPQGYDERTIAYIRYKGVETLMDFRPEHQEKTFCCPRTWEFMDRLIRGKTFKTLDNGTYEMEAKTALYAGVMTSGVAVDFVQFTKVHEHIISVEDVVRDPTGCPVPQDSPSKWMTITHLGTKITEKNLKPLCTYAARLGIEFRVLFFRTMMVRHPELRQHPEFAKSMVDLSQYLNS